MQISGTTTWAFKFIHLIKSLCSEKIKIYSFKSIYLSVVFNLTSKIDFLKASTVYDG